MRKFLFVDKYLDLLRVILTGPQVLAFLPAICLAAFWLGGERALFMAALGLPLMFAATGIWGSRSYTAHSAGMRPSGLVTHNVFQSELQILNESARSRGENAACIAIALDDFADLLDLHGQAAADHAKQQFRDRVLSIIRNQDIFCQIDQNRFLIGLNPSPHLDLEACIQMSGRLQSAVEEPLLLNGVGVYQSCSIGFCLLSDLRQAEADEWIGAATAALAEAQRNGPSTIRAYSKGTRRRSLVRANLRKEFEAALDNGEIRPWFQPQVSTETGNITGFEALARWEHPGKGVLGPQVFLPFAEQAELMERLGQVMRHHAFEALRTWDSADAIIPRIGINFSSDELRNPNLIDRLKWELDQFELTPDRLAVEILETVFSRRPDDVITRNVTGMAALGCCIDLDDFGTGHASIASIKRFDVSRIKIDRTFVAKSDQDPSQQQLVSAILTMAERLNLETLAEGVETPGEHALMAQLGSNHVQGFGIAKPMPFEQTMQWITAHRNQLKGAPRIGGKMG
ncbi:bifunctional diguanylate cyclase/phosphodiesterase [Ruegeria conchae]|uniref:Diguanylate cyclase/phosphodiesterase n=1 Tax=Ruegeria conchae TaxID=981384 RepID=A0A497ZXW5_9RHOB|nr:bifunctional diguanylate cyclase/phosphodiesterase [Ruegeria conchae]RLK07847.1 diguanylate cyclase/phosphodiesterase [Ruegeria conchae]